MPTIDVPQPAGPSEAGSVDPRHEDLSKIHRSGMRCAATLAGALTTTGASVAIYGYHPTDGWADPWVYYGLTLGFPHDSYHASRVGMYAIPSLINRVLGVDVGFQLTSVALVVGFYLATTLLVRSMARMTREWLIQSISALFTLLPISAWSILSGTAQGRVSSITWIVGCLLVATAALREGSRGSGPLMWAIGAMLVAAVLSHPVGAIGLLLSAGLIHGLGGVRRLAPVVAGLSATLLLAVLYSIRRGVSLIDSSTRVAVQQSLDGIGQSFVSPVLLQAPFMRGALSLAAAVYFVRFAATPARRLIALVPLGFGIFDVVAGGGLSSHPAYVSILVGLLPLAAVRRAAAPPQASHRTIAGMFAVLVLASTLITSQIDRAVLVSTWNGGAEAHDVLSGIRDDVLRSQVQITVIDPTCDRLTDSSYSDTFRGATRTWNSCDSVAWALHGTAIAGDLQQDGQVVISRGATDAVDGESVGDLLRERPLDWSRLVVAVSGQERTVVAAPGDVEEALLIFLGSADRPGDPNSGTLINFLKYSLEIDASPSMDDDQGDAGMDARLVPGEIIPRQQVVARILLNIEESQLQVLDRTCRTSDGLRWCASSVRADTSRE